MCFIRRHRLSYQCCLPVFMLAEGAQCPSDERKGRHEQWGVVADVTVGWAGNADQHDGQARHEGDNPVRLTVDDGKAHKGEKEPCHGAAAVDKVRDRKLRQTPHDAVEVEPEEVRLDEVMEREEPGICSWVRFDAVETRLKPREFGIEIAVDVVDSRLNIGARMLDQALGPGRKVGDER